MNRQQSAADPFVKDFAERYDLRGPTECVLHFSKPCDNSLAKRSKQEMDCHFVPGY